MAKLVTLYRSDGDKFEEEYLVATDWSLVRNPPPNYPPTTHTHPKSEITDFAHVHEILTIQRNGVTVGSYDGGVAKTINITDNDLDTKNTAGATNTSSKIFLVGATSQGTNPQTYSHDTAYVGTDGALYSESKKVVVADDARLSDSRNANDVYSWAKASVKPSYNFSEIGSKPSTLGGYGITNAYTITEVNNIANGKADLVGGKIPAGQLPSFVDDVLEYAGVANFPATGESGKIYTDTTINKVYRWGGSSYVEISASIALGETSATAYRGDRGKIAYEHAISAHNYIPVGGKAGDSEKLGGLYPSQYTTDTELTNVLSDYYTKRAVEYAFVTKSVYEKHSHDDRYATKDHVHTGYLGKTETANDTLKVDGRVTKIVAQSVFNNAGFTRVDGYYYIVYKD